MDRWKAEMGTVREKRRVEERRVEERKSEKRNSQKKEDAGARKGRKVAKHCAFPMICGSEGPEVGSRRRQVRSHVVRWEMKSCTPLWREASKCTKHTRFGPLLEVDTSEKCTPLWREAHFQMFQVKLYKATQYWTTFGSWDVEKVHAVVARSRFPSQNAQNTSALGALLRVATWKKCTPLWHEAHFEVKMLKAPGLRTTFGRWDVLFRVAGGRDCAPCQKWAKREGVVAFPKTMAGVGHKMHFPWQAQHKRQLLGGPGADFLRGVAFWSLRSSGVLRWFCATGAALRMAWHHFFVAGAIL